MTWKHKDLLDIQRLSSEELEFILATAKSFKEILARPIKKVPALRGKTVVTFFLEPSTRTRSSFELAAKMLSADTVSISASTSSTVKGETLIDTARNLEALQADVLIVRHAAAGAPHMLSRLLRSSVINAGDGAHEHPTQALLDMFTIMEHKGRIKGLNVVIVGDITHSRVARSNIWGLNKLGASVTVCGPATLMPQKIEKMDVTVSHRLEEVIEKADVIMMLRIQLERQQVCFFPSLREYTSVFGIWPERLNGAKEELIVMHPGPINRGVEISSGVADGPRSVILDQVTNGLAIRMAILYLVCGGRSIDGEQEPAVKEDE